MKFSPSSVRAVLVAIFMAVGGSQLAMAQALAPTLVPPYPEPKTQSNTPLLIQHKWIAVPPRTSPAAFFTNLKNGDSVISPFVVQFGMTQWGIAPAEHSHARTGHHHILVGTALPVPLTASIPTNKNYLHFGKGQMQTVLDLAPGKHTLRLLLADHNHVPLLVFSDELTITVTQRVADKAERLKKLEPELSFPNLQDGDTVKNYFKIQFHAAGLNVAHQLTKLSDTGYFQLKINPIGGKQERIAFPNGHTEAWLKLPSGDYTFQLEFVKNPTGDLHTLKSKVMTLKVSGL